MGRIASQILKGRVCIQVWDEQDLIDSFFFYVCWYCCFCECTNQNCLRLHFGLSSSHSDISRCRQMNLIHA